MSIRQTEQEQITALYERLSRDDEQLGDSNSIVMQKRMLEDYAAQHGFSNCAHYTDDGYTGGNFERPDWKRLVADIENGKVAAVLVKDMSRVGRDYLQTGFYTEVFFPQHGVRFIAIANGVDSADRQSGEFAPFLNIMNEWYLRDASRKQKQSYLARSRANIPFSNKVLYGYKKDPEQKHHLLIDEESAAVVREVFALALKGYGPAVIANKLRERKIERPSYYMHTHGLELYATDLDRPYDWAPRTVAKMLSRPEYLGHTVNHRTDKETYKSPKVYCTPDQWQIIENTHEPIIDQSTFEAVQQIRKTVRRTDTTGEPNVFTGLVYCADCGGKMYNHRGMAKNQWHTFTPDPVTGLLPADSYQCRTYTMSSRRENKTCFSHYITTQALRSLTLDAIRTAATFAIHNKPEFLRRVREASALNRLPLARYEQIAARYEAEQADLQKTLADDQGQLAAFDKDTDRAEQFLFLAKRYTDFSVLTNEMILEFVDRILVHGPTRVGGVKMQKVDIFLKHIGKVDLPEEEPPVPLTEEELVAEKRRRRQEYDRRYYYEKRKPKMAAAKAAQSPEPNDDPPDPEP